MMRRFFVTLRRGLTSRRSRMAAASLVLGVVLLAVVTVPAPAQVYGRPTVEAFPHKRHGRLFPTCTGCHAGATTGDTLAVMPPPSLCAECHDGIIKPRVPYVGAPTRHDFLRFVHKDHATRVDAPGRYCQTCHAVAPGADWMDVRRAPPEICQSCHATIATGHLSADSRCAKCHLAAAASKTLTAAHLSSLPKPPSHNVDRYLLKHNPDKDTDVSMCAICHTRESCARCHVNAADVKAITSLLPDARVAAMLRGKGATYLTPDDHRADSWSSSHGRTASSNTRRCGACHAQPSCTVCHTGTIGMSVIRRLPDGLTSLPGVQLVIPRRVVRPEAPTGSDPTSGMRVALPHADPTRTVVRPHPLGFDKKHASAAGSGRFTCEGCHAQRFCSDCHAGESRRNFHGVNFVARHARDAYGRDIECAGCHNAEVFCRGCHQKQGLARAGQHASNYHNRQPLWLLQHGQAARRGIEGCITCHAQRDCLRCHSQRGWGVNPHGADFDASRLGKQASTMCLRCHLTEPTRGRS